MDPPGETSEDLGLFLRDALKGAARAGGVDLELRVQRGRMAVVWALQGRPDGQSDRGIHARRGPRSQARLPGRAQARGSSGLLDVNELLRSREFDAATAVQAFLDLRYPDSAGQPSLSQLDEVILGPGYEHFDILESEWAKSAAQGLVPAASQDFAAIFEGVETQLAAALTHLDPPTNPGIDVSP